MLTNTKDYQDINIIRRHQVTSAPDEKILAEVMKQEAADKIIGQTVEGVIVDWHPSRQSGFIMILPRGKVRVSLYFRERDVITEGIPAVGVRVRCRVSAKKVNYKNHEARSIEIYKETQHVEL